MSPRDPFHLPGHGLILDGHAAGLSGPRDSARDWLAAHGVDSFTAEDVTEQAKVGRAWYADELGFVGEDHPAGRPVTVVHLPEGVA
jgi:hypothetical protein